MRFAHLAQRLFNTPLMLKADKAEVVMAALGERLGITQLAYLDGKTARLEAPVLDAEGYSYADRDSRDCGYDVLGGVATIEVAGTLVQKNGYVRPYSGMTGYDGIRQAFLSAVDDAGVKAIVLDIDSPGGEVAGCFDLADLIYQARGIKPIWAILNEGAYSAAYAIASAADRIYVPRTGGTGSIGVICMHVDMSKAISAQGLQVTFITHGERKADGHAELPLSAEALAKFQDDINAMGELFCSTVARNRGLSVEQVRDLQAATFLGAAGVKVGLADAVAAPDAAFRVLLQQLAA